MLCCVQDTAIEQMLMSHTQRNSSLPFLPCCHRTTIEKSFSVSCYNLDCNYIFPIDLAPNRFRLVVDLSEKCNYNQNLGWIQKILKRFLCVRWTVMQCMLARLGDKSKTECVSIGTILSERKVSRKSIIMLIKRDKES